MRIMVDTEKCTGCKICELACSSNMRQNFMPKSACIKVVNLDYWGFSNPVLCIQCKKPACVINCPNQALKQTVTGTIQLDEKKCNGCGICVSECHIGAINWDDEYSLPMICNLCNGKPVCVEWCPSDALSIRTDDSQKIRGRGKPELKYSIAKGKRSLRRLNIPAPALDWYDKFI